MFIGVGSIILPMFSPHRWGQWPQLANRATPRSELSWSPCRAIFQVWCRRLHWFAFLVMNNVLLLLLPFFQFVFDFVFFFLFFFFFFFFFFLFLLICFVMICIPLPFHVFLILLFLKLKSWNGIICYFLDMMSCLEGPLNGQLLM